jgi:organic radical activating enzyme
MQYPITEIFHSVQGEGLNAGRSAWFIRLAGCNLRCPGCDEPLHDDKSKREMLTEVEIVAKMKVQPSDIVVITGGEPAMYKLEDLVKEIRTQCIWGESEHPRRKKNVKGPLICIETNGTLPIRGKVDFICVSPKPNTFAKRKASLNARTIHKADEIKLVVGWSEDPEQELQVFSQANPRAAILLSPITSFPEGELDAKAVEQTLALQLKYPQARMSPQWHKWLKLR